MPVTTEHHILTLEWAIYPTGKPEVASCFCSCDERPDYTATTITACTDWFKVHAREAARVR